MRYVARELEADIQRQLDSSANRILLISGARQTGKTTLIENVETPLRKLILNFWDEEDEIIALREARSFSDFERYLKQFFGFTPDASRILVIDEAQAASRLALFLMEMHRKWKQQRVVLLGSVLANLFSANAPVPVGRTVELVVRPLCFREFLRFRDKEGYLDLVPLEVPAEPVIDTNLHGLLMHEYERFLQCGGLPGIVDAYIANEDTALLMESLLGDLYRDADRYIYHEEGQRRSRAPQYGSLLEHALKAIGYHVGQPTKNSTILSTDSPAYRTILPRVLEAMNAWHLAYFLPYETKQLTTKKGYSSKKYLFDTGLVNFLINRHLPVSLAASSESSEATAKLLENAVLQDLVVQARSIRNISSYKSHNKAGSELDFVATIAGEVFPVEVKSASRVNRKSLSQLLRFLDHTGSKRGFVIYTGLPRAQEIERYRILHLPPYYLPLLPRIEG